MEYTITPMTPADTEGKAYVHWKAWQETYAGLVDPGYLEGLTLEKCGEIARRWPDNLLVAKAAGRVVGFAGFGPCMDPDSPNCGEVYSLYVLREFQNRKIGYALMNAAVEKLKDYRKIVVWVLRGNEKAIRFYERYGFRFDGVSKEILLGTPNVELRMVYTRQ